jgi:hypothetical protein
MNIKNVLFLSICIVALQNSVMCMDFEKEKTNEITNSQNNSNNSTTQPTILMEPKNDSVGKQPKVLFGGDGNDTPPNTNIKKNYDVTRQNNGFSSFHFDKNKTSTELFANQFAKDLLSGEGHVTEKALIKHLDAFMSVIKLSNQTLVEESNRNSIENYKRAKSLLSDELKKNVTNALLTTNYPAVNNNSIKQALIATIFAAQALNDNTISLSELEKCIQDMHSKKFSQLNKTSHFDKDSTAKIITLISTIHEKAMNADTTENIDLKELEKEIIDKRCDQINTQNIKIRTRFTAPYNITGPITDLIRISNAVQKDTNSASTIETKDNDNKKSVLDVEPIENAVISQLPLWQRWHKTFHGIFLLAGVGATMAAYEGGFSYLTKIVLGLLAKKA